MDQNTNKVQAAFEALTLPEQIEAIRSMPLDHKRACIRVLDPSVAALLIEALPSEERSGLLALLDKTTRAEVNAILAYNEDVAAGRMNPHFIRVRPDMNVQDAIVYVRKQIAATPGAASYVYVLDANQVLLGVLSMKQILIADSERDVRAIMRTELVTLKDKASAEEVANTFAAHPLAALPIVDEYGRMTAVKTSHDVVHVVRSEATEDIHKLGGSEALDVPYLTSRLSTIIKKRAGWLVTLFLGEMLTASAMSHFEDEIAKAVVLALFVPLIISSGGNAGSQASTLVIRAMALGEVRLKDWWRVIRREVVAGLALGCILGTVGFLRITIWQQLFATYGGHYLLVALTVALSLVGVVLWGSIAGSFLPFVLRRLGFDPASASSPFVATLVDVTGLVIYFTVAKVVLTGTVL